MGLAMILRANFPLYLTYRREENPKWQLIDLEAAPKVVTKRDVDAEFERLGSPLSGPLRREQFTIGTLSGVFRWAVAQGRLE
jgi:hypothetical protein